MNKKLLAALLLLCMLTGAFSGISVQAESRKVYVVSNTLKVYAKASTSSSSLGTMAYGQSMTCLAFNDSWAYVKNSSGKKGFCKISGLSLTNPNSANKKIYVTSSAKVYIRPDTSSTVITTLSNGSSWTAVAMTTDGNWLRLKNGSRYGYIRSEYASLDNPNAEVSDPESYAVYVTSNTLVAYKKASTSSKKMGILSYGEEYTLLAANSSWARLQNSSGSIGYAKLSGLSTTDPNTLDLTVYVTASTAKLYSKPLISSTVVATAEQGESYQAVALTSDNTWLRLKKDSSYCYVQTACVSAEADESVEECVVYVTADSLKVYKQPSTSSTSLGTMYFGESMLMTGRSGSWLRVQNSNGTVGYCAGSGASTTDPNKYNVTLYVQVDSAKVYAKPLTSSSVLGTLSLNAAVTGIAISSDSAWIRLKSSSDSYGYIETGMVATSKSDNTTLSKVVALAKQQLGKPYAYGACGPSSFDCSGLTYYVFKNAAEITLKRTAYTQGYNDSYTKISGMSSLKVGDLVFFNTNSSDDDLCDHVGIYLGSSEFIHASSAGGKVMTSSLSSGYYERTFSWGRRIL